MRRPIAAAGVLPLLLALAGCATGGAGIAETQTATATSAAPTRAWFDGSVDVGAGRTVNATCWGAGETAVIYLHGLIQPDDAVSWAHAPELQSRLSPEATYCEYERANVGRSSDRGGPVSVTESVADLRALIEQLDLSTPVVLVGGSFGGLVAYTYAGTHPADVAGVVLLDPTLPDELALDALVPEQWRLTSEAWRDNAEQLDVYGAYAVAQAALAGIPRVPGTVLVTEELGARR